MPTGIWTARRRRQVRRRRRRRQRRRRRRRRRRTALIKSNNPHLAGGELCLQNLANHGCTKSSPRSMQRTSRNEDPHRLDFAHFTSLENIPTYTIIYQLCQPPCITCNRQDSTVSSRGSCGSAGIWS